MSLANALRSAYPGITFSMFNDADCQLCDDGAGSYIAQWNRPEPKPDEATLLANFDVVTWAKTEKKANLAAARYAAEIGGMVWNGWPLSTDERSRISMLGAVMQVNLGLWSGGWKFADGVFRELTGEQVVAMSVAVGAHVAACFAQEAMRLAALEAAADLAEINAVVW